MNIIKDKGVNTKSKPLVVKTRVIGNPFLRPLNINKNNVLATPSSSKIQTKEVQSSTSRSKSTNKDSHIIISVCEGRGKAAGIVGVAAIDIHRPILILSQISDSKTYTGILTKLNILNPVEVIVPATFVEGAAPSRLTTVIVKHFPNFTVTTVSRTEFNRSQGLHYINTLCAPRFKSVVLQIYRKFYAAAAACALFRFVEQSRNVSYAPKTIKVEYQEPEDTTAIDIDTADLLQLVTTTEKQQISLFTILNHCCTSSGYRLLRTNILQPPCHRKIIETRLDCVQELLENPQLLARLQETLRPLADIDQALVFGTVVPAAAAHVSERQLNYTLQLKGLLSMVQPVVEELKAAKHPLFRDIYNRISVTDSRGQILKLIAAVVNDDAHLARGQAGEIQRCFALKSGIDGFLDLTRRVYTEGVDSMRAYVDKLSEKYNLPFRVQHTIKNGFHIVLPLTKALQKLKRTDLPDIFNNVERFSNHYSLNTMEMINFDKRLKSNAAEIQSISNTIIYKLLTDIRPYIGDLYQLCDDIAHLDLLVALAVTSSSPYYVRPRFTETHMELKGARHPLLERVCDGEIIANDIVAFPRSNLHILTGPNMAGKSVYIRSICLLQVLGQLGAWVPCTRATLRISDRIFARVAIEDSLDDGGASSFALEMAKTSYLLSTISDRSLVILDELCRTTASDEGAALALAICERLQKSKAFIFVTTHFISLTVLADMYANVANWHLETLEESRANNTRPSLKFTYRVLPGCTNIASYGIKLNRILNGSQSISDRAEVLYNYLLPLRKSLTSGSGSNNIKFQTSKLQAEFDLLQIQNKLTPEVQKQKIVEFKNRTGVTFEPSPFLIERSTIESNNNKTSTTSGTMENKVSETPNDKNSSSNKIFSIPKSASTVVQENLFSFNSNDIEQQIEEILVEPDMPLFDSFISFQSSSEVKSKEESKLEIVSNVQIPNVNTSFENNNSFISYQSSSEVKNKEESKLEIMPNVQIPKVNTSFENNKSPKICLVSHFYDSDSSESSSDSLVTNEDNFLSYLQTQQKLTSTPLNYSKIDNSKLNNSISNTLYFSINSPNLNEFSCVPNKKQKMSSIFEQQRLIGPEVEEEIESESEYEDPFNQETRYLSEETSNKTHINSL